ncbi:hypothetical protein SAMN04489764_4261 [Thermostaphylospora chromogena]|uniref:Uncharacterized protein n=1 Tax=Thermostaphylospora chromogena TaxID=35622 RepID=A0A1H1HCZ5_9ACTN|nr:hypothetical protein SAMN04489764_4261 [Thermostaphylospora chromogena]
MSGGAEKDGDRFRDPLVRVYQFTDSVLVRCPVCDGCAVVLRHPASPEYPPRFPELSGVRRRLRCRACGFFNDESPSVAVMGGPIDPFFRLPLWLQANCRGYTLWAYNVHHLDLLESYIAARLRERRAMPGSMSMLARLPVWMKSAKNRDEVLRVISRMRATLPRS